MKGRQNVQDMRMPGGQKDNQKSHQKSETKSQKEIAFNSLLFVV